MLKPTKLNRGARPPHVVAGSRDALHPRCRIPGRYRRRRRHVAHHAGRQCNAGGPAADVARRILQADVHQLPGQRLGTRPHGGRDRRESECGRQHAGARRGLRLRADDARGRPLQRRRVPALHLALHLRELRGAGRPPDPEQRVRHRRPDGRAGDAGLEVRQTGSTTSCCRSMRRRAATKPAGSATRASTTGPSIRSSAWPTATPSRASTRPSTSATRSTPRTTTRTTRAATSCTSTRRSSRSSRSARDSRTSAPRRGTSSR